MTRCTDCPRSYLAERTPQSPGFCGVSAPAGLFRVAKIMLHHGEEPFISGSGRSGGSIGSSGSCGGSGAIFFSGCALRCVFCQNDLISRLGMGEEISLDRLCSAILSLAAAGAHNVNLVTASHYVTSIPDLILALRAAGLTIPIVWNSSAYETVSSLRTLEGLVDIFLPDFKFVDEPLSRQLTGAANYSSVATRAIAEMVRQQPKPVFDKKGLMRRGTAIRHLVLPGQWRDSIRVIDVLSGLVSPDTPLSIMSQYTPPPVEQLDAAGATLDPQLKSQLLRRITTFEYQKVIDHALARGFRHILAQDRSSAVKDYTPDFKAGR